MAVFKILAHWDPEAGVWWAESEDIHGVVAEADTVGELLVELREIVPDLLKVNHGADASGVQVQVLPDRTGEHLLTF